MGGEYLRGRAPANPLCHVFSTCAARFFGHSKCFPMWSCERKINSNDARNEGKWVMRALIRIVICLTVLQVFTPQSGSITVAGEQSKKVQRSSNSAAKNRAEQIRARMSAAANGDSKKVFEILDNGLSVNATFERDESEFSGMTVLMV